jgi:hypothetical protein
VHELLAETRLNILFAPYPVKTNLGGRSYGCIPKVDIWFEIRDAFLWKPYQRIKVTTLGSGFSGLTGQGDLTPLTSLTTSLSTSGMRNTLVGLGMRINTHESCLMFRHISALLSTFPIRNGVTIMQRVERFIRISRK